VTAKLYVLEAFDDQICLAVNGRQILRATLPTVAHRLRDDRELLARDLDVRADFYGRLVRVLEDRLNSLRR
jgi:hypothetical protein